MNGFFYRRCRHLLVMVASLAMFLSFLNWRERQLANTRFDSGYGLLLLVISLLAFHWRKRLHVLPLGPASNWMQFHLYAGIAALPVYLSHAGLHVPAGRLNGVLAMLFLATFFSGLFGIYLTRTFPARLTNAERQVRLDRIPAERHRIAQQIQTCISGLMQSDGTTTLASFYERYLARYMEQPRGWRFTLRPTIRERRDILAQLTNEIRYLSPAERTASDEVFRLIRHKDDLDYQYALQVVLRCWLFVHLALSYSLLIIALVHGLAANSYSGGAG